MTQPAEPGPAPEVAPVAGPRTIRSEDLLAGRRVVLIRHGTEDYRLQLTGGGKLILTK